MTIAKGSGGGKGGGSADITETSGTSTDYANVLMALGEGPIEGIKDGEKGFYLDDTPLKNADNSENFPGMTYYFTPGNLSQPGIPAEANEVAAETNVGVEVLLSIPVTRNFINAEVSAIRVRIGVQLQKQEDDGDVKGESVEVRILIKEGTGGAFTERLRTTIAGRFPELTVFQYLFYVNNAGGTVDDFSVRVEKLSQDGTDTIQRNLQFLSFSEVVFARLEYPNTALAWVQFPSRLFKSTPKISIDVGGVLFPIPSNGIVDPTDGGTNYSGGWNGSFYVPAYATSDPAWILYGILTNTRYGLGREIGTNVDKWALYETSVYNNEFVNDGFGGTERRFLFNGVIQGDQDAWEVITAICSNFAAKPFWDGSQISFWQDRPWTGASQQFTNADVEDGRFIYTSSEYKAIATVARVTYNPYPKNEPTTELVEDPIGLAQYGVHFTDFTAFGETRRGGAVRAGRRVLLSTRLDNEQISFKARATAAFLRPGDVIQVTDARRTIVRKGGLISTATATSITTDAPVQVNGAATVFVTKPDLTVEERTVTNAVGTHTTINVSAPFTFTPLAQSTWILQDSGGIIRKYRVLSVAPDESNPSLFEVNGLLYSGD